MPQGQHMEKFNFISSMTEHLAWPLTCLVVLLVIRKQLIALFSRLGSIKHGDTEFQFSKGSEALIKKEATSPEVKEKIRHQQIVTTQKWETGYYTLYSNGVFVQRQRIGIRAGHNNTKVTFPVAFPNEATSIQFIASEQFFVSELSVTGTLITHSVSHEDRQVDLILSGL
jgi:hypothetical protein